MTFVDSLIIYDDLHAKNKILFIIASTEYRISSTTIEVVLEARYCSSIPSIYKIVYKIIFSS